VLKSLAALLIATMMCLATIATARAQDRPEPWVGTWKVDLERSTYSPGPKPSQPAVVTMEMMPGGAIKTTIDTTDPTGQPAHTETIGMFDGKQNPVTGAAPNTTTAYTRLDERTFQAEGKVNGTPTLTTRVTISADGNTLTATQTGKNAQGDDVSNVIVARRQ